MARYSEAADVYQVAKLWADDCLLTDGSLLWPGRSVWTRNNLRSFWNAFIENPDEGADSFITKWSKQLDGLPEDVYRLAVEVSAVYCLFPFHQQWGSESKKKLIEQVIEMAADLGEMGADRRRLLDSALESPGIGHAGPGYLNKRPFHIGFFLAFSLLVKESDADSLEEVDVKSVIGEALELSVTAMNFHPMTTTNVIPHLLFPDDFEGTASVDHKLRMARNLSARFGLTPLSDVDETILQARRHMESNGFERDFSMYSNEVRPLWDFSGDPPLPPPPPPPPPITDLATATHLDESFLREIKALLRDKKQLIFEGPPGSGKTFVAEKFARYFTGQPLNGPRNEQIERIQFHQSYSYEDFVEGIRPDTNDDGQLVYDVVPGIFLELVRKASERPEEKFVLIIDEINRGNVSRILGELMLLLEYREQTATLPYSKQQLTIPENLYIIGTMNSADRSLSQIDYALRRRFYFVRFMSVNNGQAQVLERWLNRKDIPVDTVLPVFIELNKRLQDRLKTDDLQVGHSYFMDDRIHAEGQLERVWKYAVMPLLREYLYHDHDREKVLGAFDLTAIRAANARQESGVPEANPLDEAGDLNG